MPASATPPPAGTDEAGRRRQDRKTKERFNEAGALVYQKASRKGLAWIPAGHLLRMSPPVVMEHEVLVLEAMDPTGGRVSFSGVKPRG